VLRPGTVLQKTEWLTVLMVCIAYASHRETAAFRVVQLTSYFGINLTIIILFRAYVCSLVYATFL